MKAVGCATEFNTRKVEPTAQETGQQEWLAKRGQLKYLDRNGFRRRIETGEHAIKEAWGTTQLHRQFSLVAWQFWLSYASNLSPCPACRRTHQNLPTYCGSREAWNALAAGAAQATTSPSFPATTSLMSP